MCPSPGLTRDRKKAELCLTWRFGFQAFGFLSSFALGHLDFNQGSRVRLPTARWFRRPPIRSCRERNRARNESGQPLALQSRSGVPPDSLYLGEIREPHTLWQTSA